MKMLKISALIASIFSIIFSLSIAVHLKEYVSPAVYTFSAVFVTLLVVFNEWVKVGELRKRNMGKKASLTVIIITFIFSFSMSTTGIYLWTNKTHELDIKIDNNLQLEKLEIEKKYNAKLDSIDNLPKGKEYEDVSKQIEFWKNRKPANIEERQMIRENIAKLETERNNLYKSYLEYKEGLKQRLNTQKQAELNLIQTHAKNEVKDLNRNDFLSTIFFLMVSFTEFVIIFIQYKISVYFNEEQRGVIAMVKDFELRNLTKIDINKVKYSGFHNIKDFDKIKLIYNLLVEVGVLNEDFILQDKATEKITNYYREINKL